MPDLKGVIKSAVEEALEEYSGQELVVEATAEWTDSAEINTEAEVSVPLPEPGSRLYQVLVINPSENTTIAVNVCSTHEVGESDVDVKLAEFPESVPAASEGVLGSASAIVQGWILPGKLVLSNDAALGGDEGFSAIVKVYKV